MSFLLVTNDDGVDSPSLIPFMDALSSLAPVRAVVPAQERSWIGKAITRFDEIEVESIERDGFEIHVADGFPADCVQLGVHSLFDERPQMVVSGINLGLNHGLAFLLSSGTVGAAVEGWITGIPSVAFSTGDLNNHGAWSPYAWSASREELWDRAAAVSADVLASIVEAGFPSDADVLSVNFPHVADTATHRVVTELAVSGYDNIFSAAKPGLYVHDFTGGLRIRGGVEGTDYQALERGHVSITPIRLAHSAVVDDTFRTAVEHTNASRPSTGP